MASSVPTHSRPRLAQIPLRGLTNSRFRIAVLGIVNSGSFLITMICGRICPNQTWRPKAEPLLVATPARQHFIDRPDTEPWRQMKEIAISSAARC